MLRYHDNRFLGLLIKSSKGSKFFIGFYFKQAQSRMRCMLNGRNAMAGHSILYNVYTHYKTVNSYDLLSFLFQYQSVRRGTDRLVLAKYAFFCCSLIKREDELVLAVTSSCLLCLLC